MSITAGIAAALTLLAGAGDAAAGQVVVPPGFAVDAIPLAVGARTRLESVRNAAYGSGVVAAWIEGGTLVVRRFSGGDVVDCELGGFLSSQSVWDVRFDTTGLFDHKLFVSVGNAGAATRSEFYVVDPDCNIAQVASLGGQSNELVFSFDFTTADHGYQAGAYLEDIDGQGPPFPATALWHATWDQGVFVPVELSPNLLPDGRTDLDAWVEFDRTASETYGGQLLVCDCDPSEDDLSAIYRLRPDLTFELLTDTASATDRCLVDLAISTGGVFGEIVYAADGATDEVRTGADLASFASGFAGIRSISVSESGDALYVLDSTAIHRIHRACPADIDGSGNVGFDDLLMILAAWGPCPGCSEDLDGNDVVDFDDLLLVLAAWGPCG